MSKTVTFKWIALHVFHVGSKWLAATLFISFVEKLTNFKTSVFQNR